MLAKHGTQYPPSLTIRLPRHNQNRLAHSLRAPAGAVQQPTTTALLLCCLPLCEGPECDAAHAAERLHQAAARTEGQHIRLV